MHFGSIISNDAWSQYPHRKRDDCMHLMIGFWSGLFRRSKVLYLTSPTNYKHDADGQLRKSVAYSISIDMDTRSQLCGKKKFYRARGLKPFQNETPTCTR